MKINEFAPGVRQVYDHAEHGVFIGKQDKLVACGLVRAEWFPGQPGNARTMLTVLLGANGCWEILKPRLRGASYDKGFGYIQITKQGGSFVVSKTWDKDERDRRERAEANCTEQETWKAAKAARLEADPADAWRKGVLSRLKEVEDLAKGDRFFTDIPDIRLRARDQKVILRFLADLVAAVERSEPALRDIISNENIVSISAAAYRRTSLR